MSDVIPDIHSKMIQIMAEGLHIGKDNENTQQRYKFRGIDDTYLALQPLLARHGVHCTPQVVAVSESSFATSKGTLMNRVVLTVEHHFYAEDGSSVVVTTVGEGCDVMDKASYKAMSGAYKYALWQAFCIPTEEVKDAEAVEQETEAEQQATLEWVAKAQEIEIKILTAGALPHLKNIVEKYRDTIDKINERLPHWRERLIKAYKRRVDELTEPPPVE